MNTDILLKAFSQGPVTMFMWENITGEWPVVEVTPNVEAITGWPPASFIAGEVTYADLIHPDDLERVGEEEDAWKKLRSRTGVNMKYRIVSRSGEIRHVSEFTQNVFSDDGEIPHLIGYIVDVTEHYESEEARRAAELAEKSKSEFLANMSHEIRTPMNGVIGMAELLIRSGLNEKQESFAEVILRSGNALLTIINDILDFSKIAAGQLTLHPEPFTLADAIDDVCAIVAMDVAAKKLELNVRIDPDLPEMLLGDVGRVRQIVTNLLGNAVKFTEEGQVFVDVSGSVQEDGIARVSLRIEDTGIGIPRDKLRSVFQKFCQVDGSTTRRHEGTGLGLSIVASLVALMDGDVHVESEFGRGSAFTASFALPVHEDSVRRRHAPVDVSGARILIVDDNATNRTILREQLAAWRFESAEVPSGEAALAFLANAENRKGLEMIVLDYHMPGMNGAQVVGALRATPECCDIPIIMLTSVDQLDDGSSFGSLKIQGALPKPARSAKLLSMIIDVLRDARTANQSFEGVAEDAAAPDPEAAKPCPQTSVDIVLAEDNEINRLYFEEMFNLAGWSFVIAVNGHEAVEFYKLHRPRLICMDVSMPVMSGVDATKRIREIEADGRALTPIIGLTAHSLEGDRERFLEAGMNDYLSKPVSYGALSGAITHWLSAAGRATIAAE